MSDVVMITVISVLGSLIVTLLGTSWLNRKNLARLTAAQAGNTNASTIEISDRIARGWIVDLEKKLGETNERLDSEARIRKGAISYIERLLDWIMDAEIPVDTLPELPETLKAYVGNN